MIRPMPQRIGSHPVCEALLGLHGDRVLADEEFSLVRLHLAPHTVQVNGMIHHAVVHEHDPQPLAIIEP